MLIVSHNVKSKIKSFKSPTHYPCGIARTSEWYVSFHNEDGNPARANIIQALGRWHVRSFMDRTSDNWKATMGRFNLNQPCSRKLDWQMLLPKPFGVLTKLTFRAHWTCIIFQTKVFLMKIWFMLQNAHRVSKTWFIKWHASDFYKSFCHQSVNVNSPIHSTVLSALRRSGKRTCLVWWFQSGFFGRVITTSWKFLSRRIFFKKKFYLITGRFSQNRG